jgi:sulfate transport system permease protein
MRWKHFLQALLMAIAVLFLCIFIVLPVTVIVTEAMQEGWAGMAQSLRDPYALSALWLTCKVAAWVVPLNALFGICAAWLLTKYHFRGKQIINTLIDMPFTVSPIIAGLMFVHLFGTMTPLGGWLADHGMPVIYAMPGLVIVSLFVTLPLVARELIPVMMEMGSEEEEAARMLGASGLRVFFSITLPHIKWGLLSGVLLCNARVFGEFGAVAVVSGHILGYTETASLYIETMYSDFNFVSAFSLALVLTMISMVTLAIKWVMVKRGQA